VKTEVVRAEIVIITIRRRTTSAGPKQADIGDGAGIAVVAVVEVVGELASQLGVASVVGA
jgi:hypothetical protein